MASIHELLPYSGPGSFLKLQLAHFAWMEMVLPRKSSQTTAAMLETANLGTEGCPWARRGGKGNGGWVWVIRWGDPLRGSSGILMGALRPFGTGAKGNLISTWSSQFWGSYSQRQTMWCCNNADHHEVLSSVPCIYLLLALTHNPPSVLELSGYTPWCLLAALPRLCFHLVLCSFPLGWFGVKPNKWAWVRHQAPI